MKQKWSDQATDATYKAIRGAGFNEELFPALRDTILVSEPEAAAYFAVRDHQATTEIGLEVSSVSTHVPVQFVFFVFSNDRTITTYSASRPKQK